MPAHTQVIAGACLLSKEDRGLKVPKASHNNRIWQSRVFLQVSLLADGLVALH